MIVALELTEQNEMQEVSRHTQTHKKYTFS